MRIARLLPLALVLAVSCNTASGPGPSDEPTPGFVLATHEEGAIDATLTAGAGSVHLLAVEVEPRVYDLTVDFGDAVLAFRVDMARGRKDFMPTGALDVVHKHLIDQLVAELGEVLPPDPEQRWKIEDVVMRLVSSLQIMPAGEQLAPSTSVAAQLSPHISCSCGNQNIGNGYYRTAGRGCGCTGGSGNGCKGRCGQGCGITSFPYCTGSTAYTQACARHDWGVGGWGPAQDDYLFKSNNCSCSGVGTCY